MSSLPDWLVPLLACPRDRGALRLDGAALRCGEGHRYPLVDGFPVLLLEERTPTHPYFTETLRQAAAPASPAATFERNPFGIDRFVEDEIVKTNGNLYRHLLGKLPRYPIPQIRLPPGGGEALLDVGCNWGRWCVSAAQRGYRPVGIDPSLDAVRAARRVAAQLGVECAFVVGDARALPFASGAFDVAFSYSVLQHFDKGDAREALTQMGLVTRAGGRVLVQMPNKFGLRQIYNHVQQRLRRDANPFRVRYWSPEELRRTGKALLGETTLSVDGFFSLNPQASDLGLMPTRYATVIRISEALRAVSERLPALHHVADSLYVDARRDPGR